MVDPEPLNNNMVIKFKRKKELNSLRISQRVERSSEALLDHYEEIRRNSYNNS
jgi:hypothetical protein